MAVTHDWRATFTGIASGVNRGRRIKMTSTGPAIAGAGELSIGVTLDNYAADEPISVQLWNPTQKCIASAAITLGASVYGAANGFVSSTVSGTIVGTAIEAATNPNDYIEIAEVR